MDKKVLVLGATGAMGRYLVPKLVRRGYSVDAVSLDTVTTEQAGLRYFTLDAKDASVRNELLARHYDAVVDFMVYRTKEFEQVHDEFLKNTGQYIFLSSYRTFAESKGLTTEQTPQLVDVSGDEEFLSTDNYALKKGRGEKILRASSYKNWTIVRPAITYSQKRCQLITLEREQILPCIFENRPVLLPETAKDVEGTMTWAGDVAEMISRLLFDGSTLGEDFNVTTAEHHTWGQIAEFYEDLFGLKCRYVSEEEYFASQTRKDRGAVWQLHYDRLFHRVMDNSKILRQTGMKQEDLMPLYDGLKHERPHILEID